jgi:shikimate dehydrogenase
MAKSYLDNLVGVFGSPVAENPTVVVFEAAFQKLGLPWKYLTIEVKGEDLADAVRGLGAMNMRGINLTIPHKVAVLKHLDEVAPDAKLMGAVNTVRRVGGKLIGENTDGKGFMRSLTRDAGVDPKGKRVILLGAGGAARAIGVELALAGAERIVIVNRTERRGKELAALIGKKTPAKASFAAWDRSFDPGGDVDIIVNATSIGLYPDTDSKPDIVYAGIRKGMVVCDVIPNPPQTPFLREARMRGAKTLDGLGMLVYQGAIAFKMWTGQDAPLQIMKEALRKAFKM